MVVTVYTGRSLALFGVFCQLFFGIQHVNGFVSSQSDWKSSSTWLNPSSAPQSLLVHSASISSTSADSKKDVMIEVTETSNNCIGTIAFLLPSGDAAMAQKSKFGIHSPVERPSYLQAVRHLASKATWFSDDQVSTIIATIPDINAADEPKVRTQLEDVNILIALGLSTTADLKFAASIFQRRQQQSSEKRFSQCQFALDCDTAALSVNLPTLVGPFDKDSISSNPSLLLPWTDAASGKRFDEQMEGLFERWTSDDFVVALMLFLNRFSGSPVNWVKDSADATWEKGPLRNTQEFYQMGEFACRMD